MIDAGRLDEIFRDCLFTDSEIEALLPQQVAEAATIVEGLTSKFGLNPVRLKRHRLEIEAMIEQLPDIFWAVRGGGQSFLKACIDRHGDHWGEHRNVEQLVVLGIAIGRMAYCAPREAWGLLPGGMPYVMIKEKPSDGSSMMVGANSVVIADGEIVPGKAAAEAAEDLKDCVAVGPGAQAQGKGALAVGKYAVARGEDAFAFGNRAQALGAGAAAIGDAARAIGAGAMQVPEDFTPVKVAQFRQFLRSVFFRAKV